MGTGGVMCDDRLRVLLAAEWACPWCEGQGCDECDWSGIRPDVADVAALVL